LIFVARFVSDQVNSMPAVYIQNVVASTALFRPFNV
jgi:TATA-box binding protein (TBP) (component of TFIID and TFIIIB)